MTEQITVDKVVSDKAMAKQAKSKYIAGFWQRIGAFVVDTIILGVVGLLLGLVFESVFVQMGSWGRLVGFIIALAYFAIGNSQITGGQTLGKKLLRIKVVNTQGTAISLGKSIFRYIILGVPFFINGINIPDSKLEAVLIYPISIIIFGGVLSTLYLYIFNRITRQSLHDLIVGTYVVNIDTQKQEVAEVWKGHFIVVAIIFILSAAVVFFTDDVAQTTPFKNLIAVQNALTNEPDIRQASVSKNTTTHQSGDTTEVSDTISVQVFLNNNDIKNDKLARRLAVITVDNYADSKAIDAVNVILTCGYDIGIASKRNSYSSSFEPSELQGSE